MSDRSRKQRQAPAPPTAFKSLIRFGNVTYRIGRLRQGEYEVVRILDDLRIGTFASSPNLTVTSSTIHPAFILSIARAAASRPSWVDRVAHALKRRSVSGVMPKTESPAGDSNEESSEENVTLQNEEEKG